MRGQTRARLSLSSSSGGDSIITNDTGLPRTGDPNHSLGAEAEGHGLFLSLGNVGVTKQRLPILRFC
jgi:hypothetical protein